MAADAGAAGRTQAAEAVDGVLDAGGAVAARRQLAVADARLAVGAAETGRADAAVRRDAAAGLRQASAAVAARRRVARRLVRC